MNRVDNKHIKGAHVVNNVFEPKNCKPPTFAAQGHWLLTSASAKVDLTQRLRKALNARGLQLYCCDCNADSAAFHFSDGSFTVPLDGKDNYLDHLVRSCKEHNIRVILPTRDEDLGYLAAYRAELHAAGIWLLASPLESIKICQDKVLFHKHCQHHNLPVLPRLQTPCPEDFPVFVRERCGSGGVTSKSVKNAKILHATHGAPPWPDLLIQPQIIAPEYSIDAIFDDDGRPLQWLARERIKIRAGESCVSRTLELKPLDYLVANAARSLHLVGPVTIQAFCRADNVPLLIEVNPRFGGAAALGIEAGLDSPARLVAWVQGDLECFRRERSLQYGLTMLRYSRDIFMLEKVK